ncbi:MAG: oligosaccharide flippase family protein [Acidobacteriaceae bacterium]
MTAAANAFECEVPRAPAPEEVRGRNWDVAQTVGTNAAVMGITAAGSVLAARLLGPSGRGQLAAVVAWSALAVAFGDLGISQACAYYGAREQARPGAVAGTSLALGIGIAAVLILCILPLRSRLFGGAFTGAAALYLVTVPLSLTTTYLACILKGMNRLAAFNTVRIIQSSSYAVALTLATLRGWSQIGGVVRVMVACQAAAVLVSLVVASRSLPIGQWRVRRITARNLLSYGSRSWVGNLFWLTNGRLDQALLSLFAPMRELGLYAVAVSYSSILFGLSGALASVVFPRVALAATPERGRRELARILPAFCAIILPLGAIMALIAPWAMSTVFGAAYRTGTLPARILLLGGVVLGLNYVISNALRASGRPGAPTLGEAAGVIVTISVLPFALNRWGILGAAVVSVLSYSVTSVVLGLIWQRAKSSK